ncbi:MAG: hypothetical protein KJ626_06255 [Verrucomicrobia bacterium]|nr:hypothetical protein [Verrucomicrobiota bacterium]
MNKRLLYALILIGLSVVVLLFNRGSVDVNLVLTTIKSVKTSLAFLGFMAVGVVIGTLLK